MKNATQRVISSLVRYGIFVALLVEFIVFSLLSEHFLTVGNQLNVLRQNAPVTIVAIGMTFVILTAGIDLSVGSLMAVAAVGCAQIVAGDWSPLILRIALAVLGGAALAALAGLLNGLIITKIRIPPFVTTLAMLTMARGAVLNYTDSRSVSGLPEAFGQLDTLGHGVCPIAAMAAALLAAWIVLTRTVFGRHVYAVGGNPEAAYLCGIRVDRVLVKVYLISGLLAGLAGVLLAARLNVGDPRVGNLFELDAIAAVVVGGTSLMGGRGSILGTLAGALVIGELNNVLSLMNVPFYSQKIVIGLVLIFAAFLDRFRVER